MKRFKFLSVLAASIVLIGLLWTVSDPQTTRTFVTIDSAALGQTVDIAIKSSTLAGLPPAGTAGRLTRVTDGNATNPKGVYLDDGSAWRFIGQVRVNGVFGTAYNENIGVRINGLAPDAEFAVIQGANRGPIEAVSGAIRIPSSATGTPQANAIAGYVVNESSDNFPVGGYFQVRQTATASGFQYTGVNAVVEDVDSLVTGQMTGMEIDLNIEGRPGTVYGLVIDGERGINAVLPAESWGIKITASQFAGGGIKIHIPSGTNTPALVAIADSASTASPWINLTGRNAGGTAITSQIRSDSAGVLVLNSAAGFSLGGGDVTITAGGLTTAGNITIPSANIVRANSIAGNAATQITFNSSELVERMRLTDAGILLLNTITTTGLAAGDFFANGRLKTATPTNGTADVWKLGESAVVSPTSPNRTIRVEIGGTVFFIHAKTTND